MDPFVSIDREGVGELIRIAAERGRKARPRLKLGICGEHGGDPASVAFCHEIGLDYVSCSPFRVPIARLAAAQAALGRGASSTSIIPLVNEKTTPRVRAWRRRVFGFVCCRNELTRFARLTRQ